MAIKNKNSAKEAIRKMTGHISFGEMLLSFRVSQELTQVQMSAKLEISKQELCNIEKGRKFISVERAVGFARLLEMPEKTFAKYVLQDQLFRAGLRGEIIIKDVA